MSQAVNVTATFTLFAGDSLLAVTNVDTAGGTVTSNVGGISCGSTCTAGFDPAISVTLTATANPGYTFAGWGEGCFGITATCTLTMSSSKTASAVFKAVPGSNPNLVGINIDPPLDYMENRLYADVMKTSRPFKNGSSAATLDTDGWPTQDFSTLVWDLNNMNGTYTLSFTGQATVTANGTPVSLTYDSGTNISTGTYVFSTTGLSSMTLNFTNTKRTSASATGTGVTSIQFMRPLYPGATQSYPSSTLFNVPLKVELQKFSVIRFMDFLATNSNQQVLWSQRMLPASPSYQRSANTSNYGWEGLGGPWEDVILLSNDTGDDAWINIPVNANDAYITNIAKMFKYGSNGVFPYSSVQTHPIYPPLNPNLHVYIEYSNELWNGGFTQFKANCYNASQELSGGSAPINWDGQWDSTSTFAANGTTTGTWNYAFCYREIAERIVHISNLWRAVWGDAAMGATVRPVFASQYSNTGAQLFSGMNMLLSYYDNLTGSWVATPEPPSYYIYGAGGAPYYNPYTINASTGVPGTASAVLSDPGMTPYGANPGPYNTNTHATNMMNDTWDTVAMGVQHVAYEGGPNLITTSGGQSATINAAYAAAVADSGMTTDMVNMHDAWSANGGNLFVYLSATGNYEWGFTTDVYNLSTPKLAAVDTLNAASAAPLTLAVGAIPGSLAGTGATACSRSYACSGSNSYILTGGNPFKWASYPFEAAASATRTITLTFTAASSAQIAVYVDGVKVDATQSQSGSGTLNFSAGTIAAGLHGIIVDDVAGTFTISNIAVN